MDGGDCNILIAFLKKRGDNRVNSFTIAFDSISFSDLAKHSCYRLKNTPKFNLSK